MNFEEVLKSYMERIGCTAKQLAEQSGLSASVISRYRNGSRIPAADSEQLKKLLDGLNRIAEEASLSDWSEDEMKKAFAKSLQAGSEFRDEMRTRLNQLMKELKITQAELARGISYDASRLSRIRSGQRSPSDPQEFLAAIGKFIAEKYASGENTALIASLIGAADELQDAAAAAAAITAWLAGNDKAGTPKEKKSTRDNSKNKTGKTKDKDKNKKKKKKKEESAPNPEAKKPSAPKPKTKKQSSPELVAAWEQFLKTADQFMMSSYLSSLDRPDTNPMLILRGASTSFRHSYFEDHLFAAQKDFLSDLLFIKSEGPMTCRVDTFPSADPSDTSFAENRRNLMMRLLQNGMRATLIHNEKEPAAFLTQLAEELPLYMTGQVRFLMETQPENGDFIQKIAATDEAALFGSAEDDSDTTRLILSHRPADLSFAASALQKAADASTEPVSFFRLADRRAFERRIKKDSAEGGVRNVTMSTLPIYTMPEDVLQRLIERNEIPENRQKILRAYIQKRRAQIEQMLSRGRKIRVNIPTMGTIADLSGLFYPSPVFYDPDSYRRHLAETETFAASHHGLELHFAGGAPTYGGLNICIHKGHAILISKTQAPAMQILISDPSLVRALENISL